MTWTFQLSSGAFCGRRLALVTFLLTPPAPAPGDFEPLCESSRIKSSFFLSTEHDLSSSSLFLPLIL